eukprot:764957-Hanusia_phi.AAC.4
MLGSSLLGVARIIAVAYLTHMLPRDSVQWRDVLKRLSMKTMVDPSRYVIALANLLHPVEYSIHILTAMDATKQSRPVMKCVRTARK